ncbi:BPI fold-containing family B member 4-like [Excalfactoria chinensis]|uniref:BPI fold-containing family B member 4-like n=1 Tax=Excalfactoria chinensis TaxID=46218 RepID=UPI003B3A5A6B
MEMRTLWCLTLLGGLLPPCWGFLNLGGILGSSPAQPSDGGLLGTGLLGEGGLLGTGLLGRKSPSTDGSEGTGGGQPGGSGLLGTGLLGGEGLLGSSVLGEKGLLGTGLLGQVGNGSLLGLDGLLGQEGLLGQGGLGELLGQGGLGELLGQGGGSAAVPQPSQRLAWLKVLNLERARVSWKVLPGGELVLNLYSRLKLSLPGIFLFLSGSSLETNITSHIALTQDSPGDLRLVVKDCRNLFGGFKVTLRKGLLTNVVSGMLNSSLRSFLPMVFCPLVNAWFSIVNMKLQFLNRMVPFGLLGKIHSALSSLPLTSEHSMDLDLQNSPFPAVFIDWLLRTAGIDPQQ